MSGLPPALTALACALALAGCAEPKPFVPSAIRIGRVDFSESPEACGPEKIRLTLSRDTLRPYDAFVATILLDNALVSRRPRLRVEVSRGELPDVSRCAAVDLADVRNTRVDVRVDLREASSDGSYWVDVEVIPPGATEPLRARKGFSVGPGR